MKDVKSKVYALTDTDGRIIRIDGGYTLSNISNPADWTMIDEGCGDRFNLCQSHYLPKSIRDERGIYRYKLVDGKPVERTQEEMDAEYDARVPAPTQADWIEAQVLYSALMTDTLLVMEE